MRPSGGIPRGARVACAATLCWSVPAAAQSTEQVNAANNPLQPTIGVNLQNYYTGRSYGLDATSNAMLLRGTMPLELFGRPQLLRLRVPIVTSPDVPPGGSQTGLADLVRGGRGPAPAEQSSVPAAGDPNPPQGMVRPARRSGRGTSSWTPTTSRSASVSAKFGRLPSKP